MKKLFKIVGIAVLVSVVLLVAVAVALPLLLDPQDVKDQLSAKVKEATGRELSIPGDVELSVFPWLGASLGKVTLGNAAGFSAPVFASTEKVDVRVKLMPLLDRRLEMDTVTVHGLTLNLERDKSGTGNWEDLAKGQADGGKGGAAGGDGGGQALAGFAIGGFDVRDGTLTFTDAAAGKSYRLDDLTFVTGALSPGESVDLELGFNVESADPPMKGRVTGSAKVDGDANAQTAEISGLVVSASMTGETLPGGKLDAALAADISVDGGKNTARVRNLKVDVSELSATGALDVSGLDKAPAVSGDLAVAQFDLKELMQALGQDAPETTDTKALSSVALSTQLKAGSDSLSLEPLKVTIDDSTLSGKLSVSNFAAPAIRFALALDAIDVDRYLPPGSETPAATPGGAGGAAAELPMETLRGLDVAGSVKAGKVTVAKLNVTDVSATLNAKDGVIRLSPVAAKLYQGTYAGNIGLDARNKQPVLTLDEKLSGVQAGPLLKDLQGKDPLSGTANVSAKLTATGAGADAIKRTLNGNVAFQFLDGAINGVNIGKMIRDARAKIEGGGASGGGEPAKTDFASIAGTATINNGLVSNQDLEAKSPLIRATGKGTASLPKETIDYRATVTLVATSKGQGGKELSDLEGVPIPLKVSGTFTSPSYGLDAEGLAKALAESKARDLLDKEKGKITEKVQKEAAGKVGDSVGKVIGGDDKGGGLLKGLLK